MADKQFVAIILAGPFGNGNTASGNDDQPPRIPAPINTAAPGDNTIRVEDCEIGAGKLKERLAIVDSKVSAPVVISRAVVTDDLDLSHTVFERGVSITESDFKGAINFSFCTFKRGITLTACRFHAKADFRAARADGDFHVPLARFESYACFDDLRAGEIFSAEGAVFGGQADFNRAAFSKSVFFCGALLEGRRAAQTEFRGEANFNDARFHGPVYFSGAAFRDSAFFDRSRMDGSAFFNCDLLEENSDPSQPRHKRHADAGPRFAELGIEAREQRYLVTRFDGAASFIGMRVGNSITFNGAQFGGTARMRADFRRMEIGGTALFNPRVSEARDIYVPVTFTGDVSFWNADIKGMANFEGVTFGGEANFEHVNVGRHAIFRTFIGGRGFNRVVFGGKARFLDAFVNGTAEFDGAEFRDEANFERFSTDGSIFFRAAEHTASDAGGEKKLKLQPVEFRKKARFASGRVCGNAEFDGAVFEDEATFEHFDVVRDIYFRPWAKNEDTVRFAKKANFLGARVRGNAEFSGTEFGGAADFTGLIVEGSAYFDARHHYDEKDNLHFRDRKIEPVKFMREAEFTGAKFLNQADFGEAHFEGKADFTGASFANQTDFGEAEFGGEAEFTGASFSNQARFSQAEFKGKADFTGVTASGAFLFKGTTFKSQCVLRGSRFTSLLFDRREVYRYGWVANIFRFLAGLKPEEARAPQFGACMDMGGCTYEHIEVKLEDLVKSLTRGAVHPAKYDRQPYSQLIKTLRAVGDDRRADYVYLRQMKTERRNIWARVKQDFRNRLFWRGTRGCANYLLNCFFWQVGNYGVQPERLLFISLFFVLLGTLVFHQRDAVAFKPLERETPVEAEALARPDSDEPSRWRIQLNPEKPPERLSYTDAFKFSLSQFIPIVDIPSGVRWRPSETAKFPFLFWQIPYDEYGTVHRIVGAIFVPLIVAALAAALYRRLQADL
jgi:uncharacterized protein YjbI with pentapeptide repeats